MAAAVLVTGNDFDKVSLFAKCLNLNFVSESSFTRIQTNYIIPSIKDLLGRMKERIWNLFQRENLVMCGDGRMDSQGCSAKYCFYAMMDHYLDVIVDCEVVDKRETGGTSTLMEKMGCKRILKRMIGISNTSELVTDACSVIMKMARELKGTSLNLKKSRINVQVSKSELYNFIIAKSLIFLRYTSHTAFCYFSQTNIVKSSSISSPHLTCGTNP